MSTLEQRVRLATLIEEVVAGKVSPANAIKLTEDPQWSDIPWKERGINLAWHTLMHFHIDEDIRAKDTNYDSEIKSSLLKLATQLKS